MAVTLKEITDRAESGKIAKTTLMNEVITTLNSLVGMNNTDIPTLYTLTGGIRDDLNDRTIWK